VTAAAPDFGERGSPLPATVGPTLGALASRAADRDRPPLDHVPGGAVRDGVAAALANDDAVAPVRAAGAADGVVAGGPDEGGPLDCSVPIKSSEAPGPG
jgi:hypothetical protein